VSARLQRQLSPCSRYHCSNKNSLRSLHVIQFGPMSITLLIGAMYGLLFATLLWVTKHNRLANRFLALLLVVIAMRLVPYIIGYAGYYDAYPWLSFLPYNASLAIGPLLYFYVRSLSASNAQFSARVLLHFIPVIVQLAYYCAVFPQPLAFKNDWDDNVHVPHIVPVELIATFASIAVYWWLSFRRYLGYQEWLAQNVSDREDHHVEWVRNFLTALGITLVLRIGMAAVHRWVKPLDYFQVFPFYAWLQLLAYYLGTEGYRNARHEYPVWIDVPIAEVTTPAAPVESPATMLPAEPFSAGLRDWRADGNRWREEVGTAQYWRDAELTLPKLARKLGTNTSDLSRAINEGLGVNFNELINRMRVDSVKSALADPNEMRSLLDIAFDAGFSSKASFNRSFKLYAGVTPTEFRESFDVSRLKS
jgi:AraC-like DNA-binding protein